MTGLNEVEALLSQTNDPHNPSAAELQAVLERVRTIAEVGMSGNPEKAARRIPAYLKAQGYSILPVNPTHDELLGIPARKTLAEVTEPVTPETSNRT